MPEAEERAEIWQHVIPPDAPRSEEIDYIDLGERYEMSGGHIRNAVLRAAFKSAQQNSELTHDILVSAADIEYQSMGKIVRQGD